MNSVFSYFFSRLYFLFVHTQDRQIDTTSLALYSYFTERVRESLRIALAFSPIGDSFKNRLRIFPSLINCCTIDWYILIECLEHFHYILAFQVYILAR